MAIRYTVVVVIVMCLLVPLPAVGLKDRTQCSRAQVHCDIDNIVVLVRHGRNYETPPWNIMPDSEEKLCDISTVIHTTLGSSYPHLDPGDSLGYFLSGTYERDLPAGQITTTNRFIRSAGAMKLGRTGESSRRLIFREYHLPAATSMSSFQAWYCRGEKHEFPSCNQGQMIVEQDQKLSELKGLINEHRHPMTVFVLSRSVLVDVAGRLDDGLGSATTRRVKGELYDALSRAYENDDDEYFYTHYWIIERKGPEWMRLANVASGSPDYLKCSATNLESSCNSIENNGAVTDSYCSGTGHKEKREFDEGHAPKPPVILEGSGE